ncbi:SRPBCC family protein [Nocardia sp. NPDC050175]|uniref:SRPBCC family protein n=1 Tax=Nocardia sp. NPDC050175 TaxID=3364317 RepID=UPI00379883A6
MRTRTALAVGTTTYLAALALSYEAILRRRCLTWGATTDEVARIMPGDELPAAPDIITTRAITIAANPAAIWPWLVQLGPGRGGAYTYDWIENLLGLNMHSSNEILPQFQNLSVGDTFVLGKDGPKLRAVTIEPEQALVFASTDGHWVWAFGLYPSADGTRLVSRNRIVLPESGSLTRLFSRLIMEPGSWIMERKMLIGIKQRAERGKTPVADRPVEAQAG